MANETGASPALNKLERMLQERPYLLADGATGTNLMHVGLQSGDAPEPWNVDHPERIRALHDSFIEAGADIILTNSFGGNFHRLKLHGDQDRVAELNEAAAQVARGAADAAGRDVLVAGSMGPTGELFVPLGPLTIEEGATAFAEQAQALARGGADLLWAETLSSVEEIEAALAGASTTGLPIVCTLSFDTHGKTMMGLTPGDFARRCRAIESRPHAFGANCGLGPAETVMGILNLCAAAEADEVIVCKGNCGIPAYVDGVVEYGGSPELMADYARLALDAGARIIGGCCGTSPDHLRAMRDALASHERRPGLTPDVVSTTLGEITAGGRAQLEGHLNADTIAVDSGDDEGNRAGRRRRRRKT